MENSNWFDLSTQYLLGGGGTCKSGILRGGLLLLVLLSAAVTLPRVVSGQALAPLELPERITAGEKSKGTVHLKGTALENVEVQLSSSDPSTAKPVLDKVTVPQGAMVAPFDIQTQAANADKPVTFTATLNNKTHVEQSTTIARTPAPPTPPTPVLTIPTRIRAGNDMEGKVAFDKPLPAAADFTVKSDNSAVVILSPLLHFAADQQEGKFTLRANQVFFDQPVKVTLVSGGPPLISKSTTVTIGMAWLVIAGLVITITSLILLPCFAGVPIWASWRWMIVGDDGRPSTSIFQNTIWTGIIIFAYSSIKVAQWLAGQHIALAISSNLVIAMGISILTRVGAKAITVNQLASNPTSKVTQAAAPNLQSTGLSSLKFLFVNDNGQPELGKLQVMAWTFIAVLVYLTEWYSQVNAANPADMALPTIDGALMVLMGLANGGYLGNKLVMRTPLELSGPTPSHGPLPQDITITCSDFGTSDVNKVTVLDNGAKVTWTVKTLSPTSVVITIPTGTSKGDHTLGLIVDGVGSGNTVQFTVD